MLVKDQDLVVDRTSISRWAEVGVGRDRPQVALGIDVEACWCGDVRVLDKQGQFDPWLEDLDFRGKVGRNDWGFHRVSGHCQSGKE